MKNSIPVLNEDYVCISKTNPAIARRMLKKGEAEIVVGNPLVIRSLKSMSLFLETNGGAKMEKVNLSEIFGKEQAIYLQNVSGGVVSLDLKSENGEAIRDRIANTQIPVCMTDKYPFDMLKKSHAFRTLITLQNVGKKPLVKVMLQEDFDKWLEKRSKKLNIPKEEVLKLSIEKQNAITTIPVVTPQEAKAQLRDEIKNKTATISEQDVITPKVLSTCQRLHPESDNKIDPIDALDIFETIELSVEDLDYIMGHCYNESIKKWAVKRQAEIDGTCDEVQEPETKPIAAEVIRKATRPKKSK